MESPVEPSAGPDIEILGQKINYPRSWRGVTVVLSIVVLIAWITYIALVESRPENLKTLGFITGSLEIDTRHNTLEQKAFFRFEFWTPSVETGEAVRTYLAEQPDKRAEYAWQIHDPVGNDIAAKNVLFGKRLAQDSTINGYRRYRVWGESDSGLKQGWWWVVGVNKAYSEDLLNWFAKTYKEHWKVPEDKNSYIEITAISPGS